MDSFAVPIRADSVQAGRESDSPRGLKFFVLRGAAPRLARMISPRPRLSKGGSSPCSPFGLRVGPVPASPLLTGCGRCDLLLLQGRDEERAYFRSEQGTGRVRKKGRGLAGGAKGSRAASFHRHSQYRTSFYRLRRGALATGWTSAPSWGRKTNTGGLSSCLIFRNRCDNGNSGKCFQVIVKYRISKSGQPIRDPGSTLQNANIRGWQERCRRHRFT